MSARKWRDLEGVLGSLSACLAPGATPRGLATFKCGSDLIEACNESKLPPGRVPPAVAIAFAHLAGRLSDLAVALKRQPPGLTGLATFQCGAACFALQAILVLLDRGVLVLSEADSLRALNAAAIPLEVMPRLVAWLVADTRLAPTPDGIATLRVSLETAARPVRLLLELVLTPSPLPPRVAAAAQASQLTAPQVMEWMAATIGATEAYMQLAGTHVLPKYVVGALRNLVAADACPSLRTLIQQQPQLQQTLVKVATRTFVLPEAEAQAALLDEQRCMELSELAETVAAACLAAGRGQHESAASSSQPAGSSSSSGASGLSGLLRAVTAVAAQPQLQARRGSSPQAGLLVACLEVVAALGRDLGIQLARGGQVQSERKTALLQALGGTALPLLCQLAGEAAAAAPGAPACLSAPGGSLATRGGGATGSFGAVCWQALPHEWCTTLHGWAACCTRLEALDLCQGSLQPSSWWAAVKAAEALLRLAPLLPHQPAQPAPTFGESSGAAAGWRTAAQVVAAAGGLAAVRPFQYSAAQFSAVSLSAAVHSLAGRLLHFPWEGPVTAECALAAFDALSTTCRYIHAVAAHQQHASSGGGHARSSTAATAAAAGSSGAAAAAVILVSPRMHLHMADTLADALLLAVGFTSNWHGMGMLAGPLPQDGMDKVLRRYECCLLLYLAVLPALPRMGTQDEADYINRSSTDSLAFLLGLPQLEALWRLLLCTTGGGGGGEGGASLALGVDVPGLLLDRAGASWVQTATQPQAAHQAPGQTPGQWFCEPFLRLLLWACELGPSFSARVAAHEPVLRTLSKLGVPLVEETNARGSGRHRHKSCCGCTAG